MFQVLAGDCRDVMLTLEAESVDAIVTDPPYELGFMGKAWDASGVAFDPETWRHALRVLKPGGHLLAFSGSRTYHRMACAIEDAGFEIRDQIMWVYGSGFPKSHDISKAIDREAGAERKVVGEVTGGGRLAGDNYQSSVMGGGWHGVKITEPASENAKQWDGWGTALKPAHEPIVVARKPFKGTVAQNVLAHGTGALNIDGCRVDVCDHDPLRTAVWHCNGERTSYGKFDDDESGKKRQMFNASGRWPANFIHDGSDEAVAGLGDAARFFYCAKASKRDREDGLDGFRVASPGELTGGRKQGSAGLDSPRAGAGRTSGRSNHHPTVKPTDLMRYLCRLVTPPGGLVLDPFTGSGSTGRGAVLEGFRFIGIEMDAGYREIAIARIQAAERSSPHGAS